MSGIRLAAVAAGLVGAFMLSAAVGGLIARQIRAPAVAVAVASPTPTPTLAVAVATPTPVPTLSPAVVVPSPTTSASATNAASPTAIPTATGTPLLSPPVTPTPLDPPTVEEFTQELAAAITSADEEYLNSRLHPGVIDRFGVDQCRRHIRRDVSGTSTQWQVMAVSGPAEFVYASDGLETVIPDAWTVTVRQPGANPEQFDVHFAPADGTWRWFTDCGAPR